MNHLRQSTRLLCLLLAMPAFAGTVFEFETKEFDGPEPILGTVQMSTAGTNTRLEIISVTSDEAGGLIYRGDSRQMIILDHLQGQYITIDQAKMDAMAAQMMQQEIAGQAPAEEAPSEIRSLGSRGEVAGVPCRIYEVRRNGRKTRELCVSNWDDLQGGQETASAIRGVVDFFESMRQALAGAGGMDVFDRQQELFGSMGEVDGYPVLYRDFGPTGKMTRETRLTAARQRDISPDFFAPPKTYTLQELPQDAN